VEKNRDLKKRKGTGKKEKRTLVGGISSARQKRARKSALLDFWERRKVDECRQKIKARVRANQDRRKEKRERKGRGDNCNCTTRTGSGIRGLE